MKIIISHEIEDDFVVYYPFNGNDNDDDGNGNDGIENGAILTTDRFGNENTAYFCNGVDNYIDLTIGGNIRSVNQT